MTDANRLILGAALALASLLTATAAPIPPPKKLPPPKWVYEIDLGPLPEHTEFTLEVYLEAPNATAGFKTVSLPGTTRTAHRDSVLAFLRKCGYRVKDLGPTAFVVEGADRNGLKAVTFAGAVASDLPASQQPLVTRRAAK